MASPIGMEVPPQGANCVRCKFKVPGDDLCSNSQFVNSTYRGVKVRGDNRFIDGKTGKAMRADVFCCNYFDWVKPKPPKPDIFMEILAAEEAAGLVKGKL
jgi:hypothetical protein